MDRAVFLDVLKDSYSAYYNIVPAETDDVPMIFRADYFSRDEKYWLTKSIKIWGNETNEFCYVFSAPEFDRKTVDACVKHALDESLPRVKPHKEHQYTNVKVIFVADKLQKDVAAHIKKLRFSKSYRFSLHGYTELKAGGVDLSTREAAANLAGHEMTAYFKKLFAGRD